MKRIIAVIIIMLILLLIKNIISSIHGLKNASQTTIRQEQQLNKSKQTNAFLREQLQYVQTEEFVEQEARDKLGLVKKDEFVVLAPPPTKPKPQASLHNDNPNWRKWLNLFL